MALSNHLLQRPIVDQPNRPTIRQALLSDIDAVLELHAIAFSDKFRAAFTRRHLEQGRAALAAAYRMQGPRGLSGMYVAEHNGRIVGTITMRTREMSGDDTPAVERAFYQNLGSWGAVRALFTLSRLDHAIAAGEGYITDVAVDERYRRQGIARMMLAFMTDLGRRYGKRYLSLYVSARNTAARNLYLSDGFTEERIRRCWWNYVLLGESRWVYMQKVLS